MRAIESIGYKLARGALSLALVAVMLPLGSPVRALAESPQDQAETHALSNAIIDEIPALSIHDENESAPADGLLAQDDTAVPAAYSSVDAGFVPPVRNQGSLSICWAFSTIAALESSLLAHGLVNIGASENDPEDANGQGASEGNPEGPNEHDATEDNPEGTSEQSANGQSIGQSPRAADNPIDLSERHLAYFTYHEATDPVGYTVGDTTKPGTSVYMSENASDTYLGAGGNPCMAAYTLASWKGTVNEEAASYSELMNSYYRHLDAKWAGEDYSYDQMLADTALDPATAYAQDTWHLTGMRQIALTDADDVKRAIMQNGAASLLMYFDDDYYNFETGAYYYYSRYNTNHSVNIVGWDDNYSAENFVYNPAWAQEEGVAVETKTRKPAHDGAWLVRNSFGKYWGNDGYFWLSYDDVCRTGQYSKAYVFEAEPADAHDNIYQHDGSTAAAWNYVDSGGSIANVFTARANASTSDSNAGETLVDNEGGAENDEATSSTGAEVLDAVSFALNDVNVDYGIQVYLNLRDATDPTSGSPAFAHPVTGKTNYVGYYTVPLPASVPLQEGTTFSVVVTLSHANGSRIAYSVDANDSSWNWVTFHSAVHARESFERDNVDAEWDDLSAWVADSSDERQCAARVKAFTRNVAAQDLPTLSLEEVTVDLDPAATVFTGSPVTPTATVSLDGNTLVEGTDYVVTYTDNEAAGTGTATITGTGIYCGTVQAPFQIIAPEPSEPSEPDTPDEPDEVTKPQTQRAENPMKITVKKQILSQSKLKKKAVTCSPLTVKRAKGTVTFKKKSGNKKILVNKSIGTFKVKKGLKAGTYKVNVLVKCTGNATYLPIKKTVTAKLKVQ